ncbi:MAG: hypothetical protein HYS80_01745 [Candidatus Aenigmarchaeota archaeon]|nr:hypothetical protein [Candidatus Aenigmarchaeota archaeon]
MSRKQNDIASAESDDGRENKFEELNRNISDVKNLATSLDKRIEFNEKLFSQIGDSLMTKLKEMGADKKESWLGPKNEKNQNFQDDIARFYRRFDGIENKLAPLEDDLSVLQGNLMAIEQNNSDIGVAVADLQETKVNIEKRFKFNESLTDSLQKEMTKIKTDFTDSLKKQPRSETSNMLKNIDRLQSEMENIKSLQAENKTDEMIDRISELERKVESIRTATSFDGQLSDIIGRLAFLDSRLVALEGTIQDIPRYSPIVVE